MAFSRPALADIIDRVKSDFQDRLTSGSAVLRKSVVQVWARVIAAVSHLAHGHISWAAKQIFPDLADAENVVRWGSIWGVTRKEADFSQGNITFTGTNGSIIPAGSELERSDGAKFTTDAEATISGGTATVAVTASTAGEASNAEVGEELSLVSPIAGVESAATVAAGGLTGGLDEEDIDDLRERILLRIRNAPQGGTEADFEAWALENSGVTRVWVTPEHLGLGTVGVSFVLDDAVSIIPDAAKIAEVQAYIDERRPVTIDVTVFAPIELAVDFEIELTGDDTAAIRAAIEAELTDLLLREAEPGGTVLLSHIREAISIAAGETDHVLTVPAANVVAPAGELHVMGTITWV